MSGGGKEAEPGTTDDKNRVFEWGWETCAGGGGGVFGRPTNRTGPAECM